MFNRFPLLLVAIAAIASSSENTQTASSKIEGRGDSLSAPITLEKGLLMVGAGHKGERNFIVQLISNDGAKTELLVNTVGTYQGVGAEVHYCEPLVWRKVRAQRITDIDKRRSAVAISLVPQFCGQSVVDDRAYVVVLYEPFSAV